MSFEKQNSGGREPLAETDALEPELRQALDEFRNSVHSWSEAAYSRERSVFVTPAPRGSWRPAAAWTLGCALVLGSVSGGVYERHHRQVLAQIAQAKEIERQKQAAIEKDREEEALLANVDTDVSRQVPSAMEPLAQLMAEDESK
jgi:hypothetical protein